MKTRALTTVHEAKILAVSQNAYKRYLLNCNVNFCCNANYFPKFGNMTSAFALQLNTDIPKFLSGCLQKSPLVLRLSK